MSALFVTVLHCKMTPRPPQPLSIFCSLELQVTLWHKVFQVHFRQSLSQSQNYHHFSQSHKFSCGLFSLSLNSKYLPISIMISYLIDRLFRSMLLSCQIYGNFPGYHLNLSFNSTIENTFSLISIFLNLRLVFNGPADELSW